MSELSDSLYDTLLANGVEVLYDDREESAGIKFNDADLIGAPYHLTIGDKGLKNGIVEIKHRLTGEVVKIEPGQVIRYLGEQLSSQ